MTDEQVAGATSVFSPSKEEVSTRSGEAERGHSRHIAQGDAPTRVLHDLLAERVRRLTADAAEPLTATDFRTVVDLCTPGLAEAKGAARHLGVSHETVRAARKRAYRKLGPPARCRGDRLRSELLGMVLDELARRTP